MLGAGKEFGSSSVWMDAGQSANNDDASSTCAASSTRGGVGGCSACFHHQKTQTHVENTAKGVRGHDSQMSTGER